MPLLHTLWWLAAHRGGLGFLASPTIAAGLLARAAAGPRMPMRWEDDHG